MKVEEFYIPSVNTKNRVYVKMWYVEDMEYRGIVQISHGMIEHIGRYDETAKILAEHGYVVVGNDHLAHGKTATAVEEFGFFPGPEPWRSVVKDLHAVTKQAKMRFPQLPVYLLGHSMGSLMLRRYMMTYGNDIAGAIIMGTGRLSNFVLLPGELFVKIMILLKGEEYHSPFINYLLFGAYNERFSENKMGKEWLSKDTKKVEEYYQDPFCQFTFSLNGMKVLIETMKYIQKERNIKKIPKDLPILFMSGTEDPFGEYGRGVNAIYEKYKKNGLKNVAIRMYDNDRHEILNETDREKVCKDLCSWLDYQVRNRQGTNE